MVTRTKKIFVGGLSAATTLEEVKAYFQRFGEVSLSDCFPSSYHHSHDHDHHHDHVVTRGNHHPDNKVILHNNVLNHHHHGPYHSRQTPNIDCFPIIMIMIITIIFIIKVVRPRLPNLDLRGESSPSVFLHSQ